jgi:NAD(P)H-dependent FMN reductase
MPAPHTVAVLLGSLRNQSVNRRLARIAVDSAGPDTVVSIVEGLGDLPFYNEDIDPDTPDGAGSVLEEGVAAVRAGVASADAVLVVAPEYNGSLPAVLKNAIDWLSRPYGRGALVDKPVGIMSASSARGGGERMRADAVKAIGIAGGRIVEEVHVGLRASEVGSQGEVDEAIVSQVTRAIEVLVDAVDASVGV